jgi:hypothetical protein
MNSNERRLRTIYLSLTPQQIVGVWLRNALQAGTFEEGVRHSPPYGRWAWAAAAPWGNFSKGSLG